MIWMWMWKDNLPGQPRVDFLQERSGFSSFWLTKPGEESGITGMIFLEVERRTAAQISRYLILPKGGIPIARGAALEVFRSLPEDEVAFHPVTVVCKDGEITDFALVRPKIACLCTDVGRSDVDWSENGEHYFMWKRLRILPDSCMGGRSIAREQLNMQILVSDAFKARIEGLDRRGVAFTQADGSRRGYADWVP